MDQIIVKSARLNLCSHLLGGFYTNMSHRLYTNDYTPTEDTIQTDLTEAAWTGYTPQSLTGFSEAALDTDDRAFTVPAVTTFSNSSGADVTAYGEFISVSGTNLYSVRRFASPLVIPDGTSVDFTLTLRDTMEPPA